MAAPKRSPFEIEQNRHAIARLYLQRKSQHAIAAELQISRGMVAYDLAAIQAQWREDTTINLDQRKAEELARIDALEREYWRAWEASHDPWAEETPPEAYAGELALKRAQRDAQKRQRTGFSGYLEGVQWCISERCKILGLYAPTKIAPTDPSGENPYGQVSDEQLRRDIVRLVAAFTGHEGGTGEGVGGGALSVDLASESESAAPSG